MCNLYDPTIGYSPLKDVDEAKLLQLIRLNKKIIDTFYVPRLSDLILVAGAGQGKEAIFIGQEWELDTFGVDLNIRNMGSVSETLNIYLSRQDISRLSFPSEVFSLIYCYHVLEHVGNHLKVLRELERILKPGGALFIGFPNKNRVVSYIGTSQKVSTFEKVKWNMNDYIYRLKGKFENKYGAHAGFTKKGFISDASSIFPVVHSVRSEYMSCKYPRYSGMIRLFVKSGLDEYIFPSNYFMCMKE